MADYCHEMAVFCGESTNSFVSLFEANDRWVANGNRPMILEAPPYMAAGFLLIVLEAGTLAGLGISNLAESVLRKVERRQHAKTIVPSYPV